MINLTTLPYPMFSTTPEEKEILRKCELYYVEKYSNNKDWSGLCEIIERCSGNRNTNLKRKINQGLQGYMFLSGVLQENNKIFSQWYDTFDWSSPMYYYVRNTLRRIWITKLLAYEGEQL